MKNIIFDIGSVIFYYDLKKLPEIFSSDKDEQEFIVKYLVNAPEWRGLALLDTGIISIPDMIKIVQDRTDHLNDKLVANFWKHYLDSGYMSSDVLLLIKNLQKVGYKIYLLSNMNQTFFDIADTSGLLDLVDGYALSFQECAIKPHTEIYKTLIDRYNLNVEESLYIDDVKENVDTAIMLGMNGEWVKENDYEDLISKLKKYDIKTND